MSLAVAIQMDPISTIDPNADSSFALALEAQARGHALFHYLPTDLTYRQGRIVARARPLEVKRHERDFARLGEPEVIDLAGLDVVLMRQDPPFDLQYIGATHLLDRVHPETLVVNDPTAVRNAPEKIYVTHFHELMPPSLITFDAAEIKAFRKEHGDVIVKPLYGNGGAGIFHLRPDDPNLNSLLETLYAATREPLMVQKYLPAIREGDKRIIMIDGVARGALNRVPAPDETRANLHVGGRAEKATLTKRDHEICEAIGESLHRQGLIFTGIDVIGGYLTEINVTSPTGLQEIDRFDSVNLEGEIWDVIERRQSETRSGLPV